jgi:hypothetical protein
MTVHKGKLKRIGVGSSYAGSVTASVLEIGETELFNVNYVNYIATYLETAVEKGTEVAISIQPTNTIVGLKIGNKIYVNHQIDDLKRVRPTLFILGTITLPLLVPGLMFYGFLIRNFILEARVKKAQ